MAKKILHKSKRIPRANWFDLGGATDLGGIKLGSGGAGGSIGMQGSGGIVNTSSGGQKLQASLGLGTGSLGQALKGVSGIGGIANGIASGINSLMNPSGNETGVGNALSAIGSVASNIPGVGGIIGAGVNLVGGLVNTMFGSNINEEFVNQTKDQAKEQGNYVSGATDNASLLSDWGSHSDMTHVSQSDVGSDGWFSNKAKNLTKKLNKQIDEANFRAWNSLSNTAGDIDTQNDLNVLANFSAYGGPLGFMGGAIDYELTNKDLQNKQLKALGDMRMTSMPNYGDGLPKMPTVQTFAKGGGIHIKKKNRGKFTDYCGGKVTSECIARGKRSSSPTIRKRATFAANARKWKHEDGGPLFTHGGIWDNGLTYINEGGSHEENPFEGVQMGVDPQGIPNLVEEGEVVYNDYVFSNRMKVPKDVKKKLKTKGDTFAEAAKELSKESEERPNDPISKNGLDAFMSALSESQEELRMKNENRRANIYSKGGKLGRRFDGAGTNSNFLQFYTPEEKLTRKLQEDGLLPTLKLPSFELPFAIMTPSQREESLKLTVPSIVDNRTPTQRWIDDNIKPVNIKLGDIESNSDSESNSNNKSNLSYLRYAPAIMSGISAFSDIFSKPDYSASDRVASVDVQPALVGTSPIGQYLSYRPLDRMFYINQLNKNAAATRRAVNNNSGGNRAAALAGILAADANYGENLGKLARQAEEYNQALKERVVGFNRQTDMFNSQQSMQAQTANQASRNSATQMRLAQAERVAQLRQAAKDTYNARRSNNLNSFITNLGNIGWEDYQREKINSNPALYYTLSGIGGVGYKGTKKNGGKLKKKRRTTYA